MSNNHPPKVFLSHASEDKERFVLQFATELRARGVDVWLDKWEMLPGDSLVDKIFEEGIKEANAILVVLSAVSISKPWVREELNASFVSRLSKGTKLIPIVLDNCNVPEALRSTLWESVKDPQDAGECVDRVVAAIFGQSLKPPLGDAPNYSKAVIHNIPDLTNIDNLVLKLSCEALLADSDYMVDPKKIFGNNSGLDIPRQEVLDSIEVLEDRGLLKVSHYFGGDDPDDFGCDYQVTITGFDMYARAYISNYDDIKSKIISLIVNEELDLNEEIAQRLQVYEYLVDHVLLLLEEQALVKLSKYCGGGIHIHNVSASLRRSLRG